MNKKYNKKKSERIIKIFPKINGEEENNDNFFLQ